MIKKLCLLALVSFLLIFNSCLGMSMDITMNKDGSGRLTFEYRISQLLESLGVMDGNESMPTVPLSKEDWNKTFERSEGIELVSYSSKKDGQDTITTVTVEFKNEKALLSLLDPLGEKASIKQDNGSGTLEMFLLDDSVPLSAEEIDLARIMLDGYNFSISFQAQGNSVLVITDCKGKPIRVPSSAEVVLNGKKVSFSTGMTDIFEFKNGLGLKFNW